MLVCVEECSLGAGCWGTCGVGYWGGDNWDGTFVGEGSKGSGGVGGRYVSVGGEC